jgi:predicted ATP-grasp superfamily ATP-dependent carboligase
MGLLKEEYAMIADTSTPVLVLRSPRHGGLAITQSLGRLGVPVYVMDDDPWTPAFSSRYCRGKFVWDIDCAPAEDSISYLAGIGRRLGRRAIIIATTDTAALFLAANADALRQWFSFPHVYSHLVQSLHSKREMQLLARSVGVPTPNAFFPRSRQDALNFAQGATFPIMIKTIEDRQTKNRTSHSKVIVRGKQELLENYEIMEQTDHPNLMFQEYIPGGEDANWMFNGYFNEDSECLFGLTGKKIRQNRPYAGVTSLGVCMANATVAEITRKFMKTIGYRGILDIGYRYDARDGLYKVFDVNPRIGCTFRLFVSDNGMDVARTSYLDLTGQPIVAGGALWGRKWMVEDLDLASAFRYWRDGKLTVSDWAQSFRGLQESAFFAPDDLRPILRMCVNGFRKLFCRSRKASKVVPLPEPSIPELNKLR